MKKRIWFAIALLVVAAFIVLGALGYLGAFTAGQIILMGAMAFLIFEGCKNMWFGGIIIPLGVLYINFHEYIGIPFIGKGPTIGIMICVAIALDIIFDTLRKKITKKSVISFHYDGPNKHGETSSASKFYEYVKFSSKVKYFDSDNFEYAKAEAHFGNLELYLNKVSVPNGHATVDVNLKMGNLVLYIPETWTIEDKTNKSFANIEENKGATKYADPSVSPVTLTLCGEISMGNIEIVRVEK